MKKVILAAVLAALLLFPSISDARGFGGGGGFRGGGFSSHSFGGSSYSHSSFGGGYSSHSYSRPSSAPRASFGGSYAVRNNPTSSYSKNYTAQQNTSRSTKTVNNYNNNGGSGGNGFFTGMMMGSMMNHPYYYGGGYGYGMGYPPYYMGGYGYGLLGGYGFNGYAANGAYYPYSPVGVFFAWFFGLLSVFFVVYLTVLMLQFLWAVATDDLDD